MKPSRLWRERMQFMILLVLVLFYFTGILGASSSIRTQRIDFSSRGGTKHVKSHSHNPSKAHSKHAPGGFRVDLIHRDAPSSPLRVHNSTKLERIQRAVEQSKDRAKLIITSIQKRHLNSTRKATLPAFETPVASDNGAYIMQLQLGTPVQTFLAIVDTGSDLVWVQCNPCRRCYRQQGPIFDPVSSSSYNQLSCSNRQCRRFSQRICDPNCQYVYEYGDQSGSMGDFSSETITMTTTTGGQQQIGSFAFGCGHTNIGSFGRSAGIVGLGQGPVSLTTQLGTKIKRRFSYCLVSFDDAPSQTSPLFFGSAANLRGRGVQSTPIIQQGSTYYYVGLDGISVGGQALNINLVGGTIVDSGTTLTLLEDSAYSAVRTAFKSAIHLRTADGSSAGLDLCFDVTGLTSYQIPTLSLHLKNADFDPPSQNYFILVNSNTLCLAMYTSGGLGLSIIGNIMQQNYHFKFDRGRSLLSFAPAACDSL
ncbi:hypothetical protein O6H91_02G041400 [Diphasiastrum complanatum]|uniref:Uncharacterized protein n=1 Tax=Diphasiastrum complanatum TaxID=34168 RepID=A0ACC2EEJ6_DIPCM|nr:hypothetical protein O6H91_02G041400 [Diphasiastrum complanatum]